MNLSPAWVDTLRQAGFEALHWSSVGDPRATDREILDWAAGHGSILITHDLDFGAILAARGSTRPSVLQLRARDVTPTRLGAVVSRALEDYRIHLDQEP